MDVILAVVFDLTDPAIDVTVTDRIGDAVSDNDALTAFVEVFGNSPKPFLPGCIPDI
jgi:hypothetical protein